MTPSFPVEDASFLNENVQKRSSTQGSGGRTKRFVMIMGTMMIILQGTWGSQGGLKY